MKLSKYKEKFIKLFKEMEEEHGHCGSLTINSWQGQKNVNGPVKEYIRFEANFNTDDEEQ